MNNAKQFLNNLFWHSVYYALSPCILQENLCSTFWLQESPAARSLGLLMSRPAKSPGRSCPTTSNTETRWTDNEKLFCLSAPQVRAPHFGRLLCWMGVGRYSRNYSGCSIFTYYTFLYNYVNDRINVILVFVALNAHWTKYLILLCNGVTSAKPVPKKYEHF